MDFVGIVAEYDPFHNGHAAQLAAVRRQGAKKIAVCVSCDATQRGGLPILPQAVRVQAALQAGADIVVALPAPYACAGAEAFAAAGVWLLRALGCDTLAFGAETPDAARLQAAAAYLQSEAFAAAIKGQLAGGVTFAVARAAAAKAADPAMEELLSQPNNILAVEYCKAILAQGSGMAVLPLPRLGVGHGADAPALAQGLASASFLRDTAKTGGTASWAGFVPEAVLPMYKAAEAKGLLLDDKAFSVAILSRLRAKTEMELGQIRGLSEGLEHRLFAALKTACNVEELYTALKTKRYPHARLRRLVLDAALGCPNLPTQAQLPPYLQVLGAKRTALACLKTATLPAATSLADLEKCNTACALVAGLQAQASDLSALCRAVPGPMGQAYTQPPVLL